MPNEIKKIKILELEPASDLGGVTNFILRIVQYVPKDLFEVHFAASGNGPAFEELHRYGVISHQIDTKYGMFPSKEKVQALKELLQKNSIDIVHAHTVRAGFLVAQAVKGTDVKVVYTAHGWRYVQIRNIFKKEMMFFVERYIVRHVHSVTYLTNKEYEKGRTLAPHTHHAVIPLSLDVGEYEGPHEITEQFIVAMIGRMTYQKDPETFIKTALLCRNIPGMHFFWAGDGELRPYMEKMIKRFNLSDRVTLLGQITRSEIITLLHKTNVLFFTSHFEGLPIVLLEAMAAQVPVVAAAVSGIPEIIVNDENGFLFKESDAKEAAEKIINLYNNKDKGKDMAQKARTLIEKDFAPEERCAQQFTTLYENVYATNH